MADALKQRIGRRLRALREDRGLTQEQVAGATECSVVTISNIERGYTLAALDTLDRLAQYLQVPLADFFGSGPETSAQRAALDMRILQRLRELTDLEAEVLLRHADDMLRLRSQHKVGKK